jgi:hypothetical protein
MCVGVHDDSCAGKIAFVSNGNVLADSEVAVVSDLRVVTDFKHRVVCESSGKCYGDFAIQQYVVSDDDVSPAGDPMKMAIGVQSPTVFFTIPLEQRFADKHTHNELINFAPR